MEFVEQVVITVCENGWTVRETQEPGNLSRQWVFSTPEDVSSFINTKMKPHDDR